MLVLARFQVDLADAETFRADLDEAREVLARCRGFVRAETGRNLDDPGLWTLVTRWKDVGSYRRALSSYEVKLRVVPLLARAVDEPTAYELSDGLLNDPQVRAFD